MAFEMQPHQLRVVQEKRELDEKREKLLQFFNTPTFRKLPQSEKTLLRLQHSIMGIYSDILNQRILGFVPSGTDDCDATDH